MEDPFDLYLDRLNVQDILYYAGYRLNRRDGLRYPSYVKVDSDGRRIRGDKFICMPGSKTCFKPPVVKSYNVISLITSFPENFTESSTNRGADLVHAVCRKILNMPEEDRNTQVLQPQSQKPFDIKDYKVYKFQRYNDDSYNRFMPYLSERGISTETLQAFGRNILVTRNTAEGCKKSYQNLSFPFQIPGQDNKIVGLEERGRARIDGTSGYKGMALGTNASDGLWIASPDGTQLKDAKNVYWFESGYDAMAYYQLHAKDNKDLDKSVFLSTGGYPSVMQFRGVINQATKATYHLCFDNDLAGRQYAVNFNNELRRIRESMPKVGSDMQEYMSTIKDGSYLKGDTYLLPGDLRHAYGKYYDEAEELLSMKECGLSASEDIKDQEQKVTKLYQDWRKMMAEKLCIGCEQGPLKDLGTYDIPEWALCAMENGDYEGLDEEETKTLNNFMEEHFPDGYVSNIDFDNPNEFNVLPAFGTRNPNALTGKGESPYQAVKTYPVHFLHPTLREGNPLPDITVVREIPNRGVKDFNEELKLQNEEEHQLKQDIDNDDENKVSSGIDIDEDGDIEINECEEKKQHHTINR